MARMFFCVGSYDRNRITKLKKIFSSQKYKHINSITNVTLNSSTDQERKTPPQNINVLTTANSSGTSIFEVYWVIMVTQVVYVKIITIYLIMEIIINDFYKFKLHFSYYSYYTAHLQSQYQDQPL